MKHPVAIPAVLALLFWVPPVHAQIQTGSILVKIVDEQGGVLPGANLTISSPVLVSGQMTGVTDSGGAYRFPSLPPGTYSVKVELPGFQTIVREGIAALVGQTTPVDLALKVATVEETVTVSGQSTTIDTTSANVNVTLSKDLLQATPGGRDIWGLLEYKVPGLVMSRPDVGGTSGGLQGTYSARGTNSTQNSQFLNGVNVGDPAAIGAAGYYYDYDAFEEIQVSTGAHDITVPTSGVFLNMATKTGGNTWQGKAAVAWLPGGLQATNVDEEQQRLGIRENGNQVDFTSDVNVTAGGPVVKNKVRFFGSFRDWRVHQNVPVAYSQTVLDATNITSGLANGTWQVNNANRLTGFYSRQKYDKKNRLLNTAAITVPDSTVNEQDVFNVYQALWNSVLTNRLFVDARVGYNTILFPTYFNGGDQQSLTDTATGIILGNNPTEVIRNRNRLQLNATFNYYLDQALGGRHEFRWGFDHAHAITTNETHRVDQVQTTYTSLTNTAQNVTLYGTPLIDKSAVDVTSLFVQDSYSVKRFTVTAGLRWERLEGYLPAQESPASPLFPTLQRKFDAVEDVVLWHTLGPRISAIYDVTGRGTTALKTSWGRYYYVLPTGAPITSVNLNANYSENYAWIDRNGDLRWQSGEQTGTPVVTSGTTTTIDPDFKRPYTDEFTAAVDHQLIPDLKLSAVFTYRQEKDLQASANPDNPYATTLTPAVDPGLDGVVGTADDGAYGFYQRLSSANRTFITNDPTRVNSYKGIELTATKRFTNRWQVLAGYTFSRNKIDKVSVDTSPNFLINADGYVTSTNFADIPHQFKLTGSYVLPWQDVMVSANLRAASGPPITRQINRQLAVGGSQTINLEPLGSYRLDPLQTLDMRVSKTFAFGTQSLQFDLDLHNLFNANTVWQVRTLTTTVQVRENGALTGPLITIPQFMSPTQVLNPRNVRFGVAYRF